MSKPYSDKQFTKDITKLMRIIYGRLSSATSFDEVKKEFGMLEGLATNPNCPNPIKTMYGLAYLMEDKEWYDVKKGMNIVTDAAQSAEDREPFCWFVLGQLYLNGKKGLEQDPVSAKYWIDKSASVGYAPAQNMMELQWGDNPVGFLDWFEDKMEGKKPYRMGLGLLIGVTLIILVILLLILR